MNPNTLPLALCVALLAAPRFGAAETAERDPLRPPADARTPAPAASATAAATTGPGTSAATDWRPRTLIASGGKRWLVQDARRYGVGDTLGSARITRIDDDAVWLSEAGRQTRVPLFGTVAKRPPGSTPTIQPSAVRKERQP